MTMLPAQSDTTPALGAFNGRLFVAWSAHYELNIVSAPDDIRGQWGNGSPLNEFSYHGPALCQFKGRLYIAWTGTDDSALLNVMSSADGQVFDRSTKVTLDQGSQYGAALATDGAALYLAWVSTLDTHEVHVISSPDGLTFNDADQAFNSSSIASPALAVNTSDGSLFMAWTEPTKDIQVGQLAIEEGARGRRPFGWLGQSSLPGQETLHGPALVMYEFQQSGTGVPRLAYSGTDDDHFIYIMYADTDPLTYPYRRTLEDSSPPDGPAMVALNPSDRSTFYMGYVRGDNHHLNIISIDAFAP